MSYDDPRELRLAARTGAFTSQTSAEAAGYVQANLVAVPSAAGADFERFVAGNARACPLLEVVRGTEPACAPGADLRTDLPRYRVFRAGRPPIEVTDATPYWRDDLVAFLVGCSFTFDSLLVAAGFRVRHIEAGTNVPMYRTNVGCRPAGPFRGPLVVSMRPFPPTEVDKVRSLTSSLPLAHGPPIATGDGRELGIDDLDRPDFGDPVTVEASEVPVFWACGVTSQLAAETAGLPIAVSHAPGHMFVTDWPLERITTDPASRTAGGPGGRPGQTGSRVARPPEA